MRRLHDIATEKKRFSFANFPRPLDANIFGTSRTYETTLNYYRDLFYNTPTSEVTTSGNVYVGNADYNQYIGTVTDWNINIDYNTVNNYRVILEEPVITPITLRNYIVNDV